MAITRFETGSRIAKSTGSPGNARLRTSNVPALGSPSSANSPFLVPTSSSVMG